VTDQKQSKISLFLSRFLGLSVAVCFQETGTDVSHLFVFLNGIPRGR
jgi:hypothetical protein